MKIKAGKKYRARNGLIVIPTNRIIVSNTIKLKYPFETNYPISCLYTENGELFETTQNEWDLIEEVLDPIEKLEKFLNKC